MIAGDGQQFSIGEDPLNLATEAVVEFWSAATAVDDPRAAVHQILSDLGDDRIIKFGEGLPAGEINDGQFRRVITELAEVRSHEPITSAQAGCW